MNGDRLGLALLPHSVDLLHPVPGTRSVVRSYLYRKAYPCYPAGLLEWLLQALDRVGIVWRIHQEQN